MKQTSKILFVGSSFLAGLKEAWLERTDLIDSFSADFVWASEIAWLIAGGHFKINGDSINNNSKKIEDVYRSCGNIAGEFEPAPSITNVSFNPNNYDAIVLMNGSLWYGCVPYFFESNNECIFHEHMPISSSMCFDLNINGMSRAIPRVNPLVYVKTGSTELLVTEGWTEGYQLGQLLDLIKQVAPAVKVLVQPIHMPIYENIVNFSLDKEMVDNAMNLVTRLFRQYCTDHNATLIPISEELVCQETSFTRAKYSRGLQPNKQWDNHLNAEYYKIQIGNILNALNSH